MPNSIVTNTAANTALRYLQFNSAAASSSVAKLSSGSRIVKASDDAASLAVGTQLKADIAALRQGAVNASQATSLLQVADGGMARISDILLRMKALAVQASSGSVTDTERAYINEEFTQLRAQVDRIAEETRFNGQSLLNSTDDLEFMVGTDAQSDKITVTLWDLTTQNLGIDTSSVDTLANAQGASDDLDAAIDQVNAARANVGAFMSRFEAVAANLATGIENIEAARSVLMDVDVAAEMAKFTNAQVLMQANVAMLAQANQLPQNLLRLLQ